MKKVGIFIAGIIFITSLVPIIQSATDWLLGIMESKKVKFLELLEENKKEKTKPIGFIIESEKDC